MITQLDNVSWSQADLAGNGEFVEIIEPGSPPVQALYVVSNNRNAGSPPSSTFVVLKSTSTFVGNSFVQKASYTFPVLNEEFAPVIAYDGSRFIHIVGTQNNASNPRLYDLVKFVYDTTTDVLIGPTITLTTATRIRSGYDIVCLSNGNKVIAFVVTDPIAPTVNIPSGTPMAAGHSLLVTELDQSDNLVSTQQLFNSPSRSRDNPSSLITFNSVSLVTPNGSDIELYYEQHPRVISFADQLFQLFLIHRVNGLWDEAGSPPQFSSKSIGSFVGRYTDNRLTVFGDTAGNRYLSQTFWNQSDHPEGIIGNVILGFLSAGSPPPAQWLFHITPGTVTGGSIVDSTLTLAKNGELFIAYLLEPFLTEQWQGTWNNTTAYLRDDLVTFPEGSGLIYVALTANKGNRPDQNPAIWGAFPKAWPMKLGQVNLNNLGFTDIPGFYNDLNFTWLRGSKAPIDNSTGWAVVAEQETLGIAVNTPFYVSGLNIPPVAALSPSSAVVLRGRPFTFDASASFDGDGDTILIGWNEDDPSSLITLTSAPNGLTALLRVPPTVGGDARSFTVAVAEADLFPGSPLSNVQVTLAGSPPVGTLTVTVPNSFSVGQQVGFTDVLNAAFLNGRIVTIQSASASQFTALINFVPSNYGPVADSGSVALIRHAPSSVTNIAISGGIATITCNNDFAEGDSVLLYQLENATFLNNTPVSVLTSNSSQFTAAVPFGVYNRSEVGFAIDSPSWALSTVSVPFNAAPQINWVPPVFPGAGSPPTPTLFAARNSKVVLAPVITGANDPDDSTTYQWLQISGTAVTSLNGFTSPTLIFITNGVSVDSDVALSPPIGEILTFSLTVNDGVNPPDTSVIDVEVDAYENSFADHLALSRSVWTAGSPPVPATISLRNSTHLWGALDRSALLTNLLSVKRNSVLDGSDRILYISQGSVLVFGGKSPLMIALRRLLVPMTYITIDGEPVHQNPTPINDAIHTEQDYTLVLSGNILYRYTTAPLINTDNPDTILDLSTITLMSFTKITCTVAHDDMRVVVLSGPDGCLLLQVRSSTLAVVGSLAITLGSNLLYGADNILWVRVSNVESLRNGQVLLGTLDNNGNTFETFIDLPSGLIIGTWDRNKLINTTVNSGEVLFTQQSSYSGSPSAPVLNPILVSGNTLNISWIQNRPDLISNYSVMYSSDGTNFKTVPINSGTIENLTLTLPAGAYIFRVQSSNTDGVSPFSNLEFAFVGIAAPPQLHPITAQSLGGSPPSTYELTLAWALSSPGPSFMSQYVINMSVDGGTPAVVAIVNNGAVLTISVGPVNAGHIYTFTIAALVTSQDQFTALSQPVSITI